MTVGNGRIIIDYIAAISSCYRSLLHLYPDMDYCSDIAANLWIMNEYQIASVLKRGNWNSEYEIVQEIFRNVQVLSERYLSGISLIGMAVVAKSSTNKALIAASITDRIWNSNDEYFTLNSRIW